MVYLSFGRISLLAPVSASSRVLKDSQSNSDRLNHRM
jgi:hypothetical protein